MAIFTFQPGRDPQPYESWLDVDVKGRHHIKVYVPSRRGWAWIELFEMPDEPLYRDMILDPQYQEPWKIEWLKFAYEDFRQRENNRKRKTQVVDVEDDLESVILPSDGAIPLVGTLEEREDIIDPEAVVIAKETLAENREILSLALESLNAAQRNYFVLSVGHEQSYADIARQENPGASQSVINKKADTVRKNVTRTKAKLEKKFSHLCPDCDNSQDV